MPRVPVVRPQVGQAPLPSVRVSPNAPSGAFGTGAAPLPDLSGVADVVGKWQAEEREKADQIAVTAADNKFAEIERGVRTRLAQAKGLDAMAAWDKERAAFDEEAGKVEAGARGDVQKAAFSRRRQARFQQLADFAASHSERERQATDDAETDAAITNRRDTMARPETTDAQRAQAVTETRGLAVLYAKRNGFKPAKTEAFIAAAVSDAHAAAIAGMLSRGAVPTAGEYLAAHRAELVGKDLTDADKEVGEQTSYHAGERAAESVWKALGPKSDADAVRTKDMNDAVRAQLGEKADERTVKAAQMGLATRIAGFKDQRQQLESSRKATVYGAFNEGATLEQLRRMPEYRALPGDDQLAISEHVVAQARQRREYTEGAEERAETRAERARQRKFFSEFSQISDPDKLQHLSENDIRALQPTLGLGYTSQLITLRRSLDTADGRRTANLNEAQFKSAARALGLNPDKPKESNGGPEALGEFKTYLLAAIDDEQHAQKKTLTWDDKQAVISRATRKFWIDKPRASDMETTGYALSAATADEIGRLYIPLAEIPADRVVDMRNKILAVGGRVTNRKLERMRAAKLRDDDELYESIAREP